MTTDLKYKKVITAALTGANATAKTYISVNLSNQNTWQIIGPTAPSTAITIQVTDISTRCPDDYQGAMTQANDSRSFWSRTVPGVYTKVIRP